jgi:hypothetical protein
MANRRKPHQILTAVAVIAVTATCMAVAQDRDRPLVDDDPYELEPAERASASSPLTFGVILEAVRPTSLDEQFNGRWFGSVSLYYDAWQIGLARAEYGDMFRLTFRSVGHDVFFGWFVEVGKVELDTLRSGVDTPTLFGLGVHGRIITRGTVDWFSYYGGGAGYSNEVDIQSGTSDQSVDGTYYVYVFARGGFRLKLRPVAASFFAEARTGMYPVPGQALPTVESLNISFTIGTTMALNFLIR